MARRYDHSKEELRDMIVQSAIELLKSEGIEKFSMRKISASIGYTVGTIYQFFPSQLALIIEINALSLSLLSEQIRQDACTDEPTKAAHACVNSYYKFACENPHRWECLTDFKIPEDTLLPDNYQHALAELFELVSAPLLHFVSDKEQAIVQSKIIWASVHGICQLGLMGKLNNMKETDTQNLLILFLDSYLQGLKDKL